MSGVVGFSPTERRAIRDGRPLGAALKAMAEAERRGARFRLREGAVYLWTPAGLTLPADLVETLRRHREEIARILAEGRREEIEERAAILEFDAGLSRREAERRARAEHDGGAA